MSESGSSTVERHAVPVELLWDLVFVFALTQVTAMLADDLSWPGLGRALVVLAFVWWAWSAFVWVTNFHDLNATSIRIVLFTAMILAFIVALAVPGAFGDDALVFAVAYAGVRLLHLGLYVHGSRRGHASLRAIFGFGSTSVIAMTLLIVGAPLDDPARTVVWVSALVIDYAGPQWLTRDRLRGLQRVAVAHFAERYGLFILICLGESIVAVGVGAAGQELDGQLIVGAALALMITVALWWTYFDGAAIIGEERLRDHDEPVLAASDGYSVLHLLLVAGIIVFAVGAKKAIDHVADPLGDAERLALCGGVALYLVGHIAFSLRLTGRLERWHALAAAGCLVIAVITASVPAWVTAAAIVLLLSALIVGERSVKEINQLAVRRS